MLAAVAAVTTRPGLAATVNATFNEPYEVARRLATLDHLSGGRAAWNVVTGHDAFTGANFRRGAFLAEADRYDRAAELLAVAGELWDSWSRRDLAPIRSPVSSRVRGPVRSPTVDGTSTSRAASPHRAPQGHPPPRPPAPAASAQQVRTGGLSIPAGPSMRHGPCASSLSPRREDAARVPSPYARPPRCRAGHLPDGPSGCRRCPPGGQKWSGCISRVVRSKLSSRSNCGAVRGSS
ncbi:LLM class flavin-dependent oxidoreductase [Streptomyces sp. NPDC093260]|uniref:LLM class flavin-dependent oxidoreductase n=1 Tax=Streptomyces sp. NPDC093260 TaxID=3155073 RepID=UPI00343D5FE1